MPSKIRQRLKATGGLRPGKGSDYTDFARNTGHQTMSGSGRVWRDIVIPWSDWFLAACVNTPGSMSVGLIDATAGCIRSLAFSNTANSCPLTLLVPIPQDIALAGANSGSGTLYMDWTDTGTDSAVAAIGACVAAVPAGSAWGDSGTSTLTSGSGACPTLTTTACEISSTSLLEFNAPATRDGFFSVRFVKRTGDADDTADAFKLIGLRLRYVQDRLGISVT